VLETPLAPTSSSSLTIPALPMTTVDIMRRIPHRYPFLLVDKITAVEFEPTRWIEGYKNITMNEPFFQGHFPNRPIMPGVLQIEALAQVGSVLLSLMPESQGKLALFAGIDNVRFRRMVEPGDTLVLRSELIKFRLPIGKSKCVATVNGEVTVEAELMFSLTDPIDPVS
jgi:3-hydroxyacyl-[acyl-carrier-protein] dehydratase